MALPFAELVGLVIGLLSIVPLLRKLCISFGIFSHSKEDDAVIDPPLLKRYSQYRSYHVPTTGYTYTKVRTFYRKHPQLAKFPNKPGPLPLLVFIHGLGGCAAQFSPLLASLINVSSCLAIDLPGCGKSDLSPKNWAAYSTHSLVQLLHVIIESHRDVESNQGVVFIAHSMGCSLSAMLASPTTPDVGVLPQHTVGLVAMCPRAEPLKPEQEEKTRQLVRIPGLFFDLIRRMDRRGGINSASVRRMVGIDAEPETKRLQLIYNRRSSTPTWRRMTLGLLSRQTPIGRQGGLPGRETWQALDVPVLLIAGESDHVTPPTELKAVADFLSEEHSFSPPGSPPSSPLPSFHTTNITDLESTLRTTLKPPRALNTTILPHPASHALPYAPGTTRTVSGLISAFLSSRVDPRLSPGWQLTYLSDSGKWEVKNLLKYAATPATSDGPIAGLFLAIKTMRAAEDEPHRPEAFVKEWGARVRAVVDVSHESPVYDPKDLVAGGVEYHKFPSVSKLPPSDEEVAGFEALIDSLRARPHEEGNGKDLIAVHCHYGYNRTGTFIICYLVDRLGWRLQDAVDEFARRRPPGVKHDYFLDALYVRYATGRAGQALG